MTSSLRWTRAVGLAVIVALAAGCTSEDSGPQATADSVAAALADLHRSQAPAADWDGFQPGSSVSYRNVGRNPIVGVFNERYSQVLTARSPTTLSFDMVVADSGERTAGLPAATEIDQLDAGQARKTGEQDIFIGQQQFHAEIYEFHYVRPGIGEYWEQYWLAAGATPDGVVRHRVDIRYDPTYTAHTDMKVTDLGVALKAGATTVRGYCFETVEGLRGGELNRSRICKSGALPGAIVTGEVTSVVGNRETGHAYRTVENFTAVR